MPDSILTFWLGSVKSALTRTLTVYKRTGLVRDYRFDHQSTSGLGSRSLVTKIFSKSSNHMAVTADQTLNAPYRSKTSFPLKTTCPASGLAKRGKGRGWGRVENIKFFFFSSFRTCDCDGGAMLSKLEYSGEPRTAVRVLSSAPVPVPVARARFKVGGAGMPFDDLQCKQV